MAIIESNNKHVNEAPLDFPTIKQHCPKCDKLSNVIQQHDLDGVYYICAVCGNEFTEKEIQKNIENKMPREEKFIKIKCSECCYWKREPNNSFGTCRYDPPIVPKNPATIAVWPITEDADWCGKGKK